MRYKERHPRPAVCQDCPEWSIKACLDCGHIRQRYEIDDQDWLNETERLRLLRLLLDVEREDQYHILHWKPRDQLPAEDTNVLILQCDAEFGHYCTPSHFRGGLFWYCEGGAPLDAIEEASIIDWDYYPYEEHPNVPFENLVYNCLKSFAKDVREGKVEWPMSIQIQKQPQI